MERIKLIDKSFLSVSRMQRTCFERVFAFFGYFFGTKVKGAPTTSNGSAFGPILVSAFHGLFRHFLGFVTSLTSNQYLEKINNLFSRRSYSGR